MPELHERRVSRLAQRVGLALLRVPHGAGTPLYQLVEPEARVPVFPGSGVDAATLVEIEDWLGFPWE
jgi:hypothetical protein